MVKLISDDVAARLAEFKRIAVAVSGGRDSVALLDWLARSGGYAGAVVVVHVDHKLRGSESDGDREFVRRLAADAGLELVLREVDVPEFCLRHGYGTEQGARLIRRRVFEQIVEDGVAERVLTAHHLSDQTESVLMHVFRGSGIDGLCGMREDDGVVFRPMLTTPAETIAAYAEKRRLGWRVDSSNADTAYSRNYLRHVVLPAIRKLYPTIEKNIARLSAAARDAAKLIEDGAAVITEERGEAAMPLAALDAPPAIAAASVFKLLGAAGATVCSVVRVAVAARLLLFDIFVRFLFLLPFLLFQGFFYFVEVVHKRRGIFFFPFPHCLCVDFKFARREPTLFFSVKRCLDRLVLQDKVFFRLWRRVRVNEKILVMARYATVFHALRYVLHKSRIKAIFLDFFFHTPISCALQ